MQTKRTEPARPPALRSLHSTGPCPYSLLSESQFHTISVRQPKMTQKSSKLSMSSKFASWSVDLKLGVLKCLIAGTGQKKLLVGGTTLYKSQHVIDHSDLLWESLRSHMRRAICWTPRLKELRSLCCDDLESGLREALKHWVSYRTSHTVEFEAPPVQPASSPMQKLSTSHSTKRLPTQQVGSLTFLEVSWIFTRDAFLLDTYKSTNTC